MRSPLPTCVLSGVALLGACSGGAPGPLLPDAGDAAVEASQVTDAGSAPVPACQPGETQPCSCADGGQGLRACVGDAFSACNGCGDLSALNRCVPGHYLGSFEMSYTPGPAGICGFATLFGGSGYGKFEFDLVEDGPAEFASVGNGCVRAKSEAVDAGIVQAGAEVFAKGVEMKAELTGVVDCATGMLQGELRGTYLSTSVCGLGVVEENFFFKGPFTGIFNPDTQTFEDGTLILREPPVAVPLAGEPGGDGTWTASLADGDAGMPDGGSLFDGGMGGDCLDGVEFQDFDVPPESFVLEGGVAADGGTPTDAGPG